MARKIGQKRYWSRIANPILTAMAQVLRSLHNDRVEARLIEASGKGKADLEY